MSTRERLITQLTEGLRAEERCRGAWLGGADASGRADALSDLDLVVIVEAGEDEAMLESVERMAKAIAPIERRYRLPAPTWHGHVQVFMQLKGLGPAGLVDLLIIHPGEQDRWLVVERHGHARVLLDRDGLIRPVALDRAEHVEAMREQFEHLKARVPVLAPLALKEAQRGRDIDALHFYHELLIKPLVTMLRIVHCPERYDFGLRYLERDLPADVYARVRELAYVGSCEDIARKSGDAMAMFDEVVAVIDMRS